MADLSSPLAFEDVHALTSIVHAPQRPWLARPCAPSDWLEAPLAARPRALRMARTALRAWAGVAPGQDDSAGQPRAGTARHGNRPRRAILTQLAPAAVPTPGTSLAAVEQRRAARRGKTRASIALADAIMLCVFPRLSRQAPCHALGSPSCEERHGFIGARAVRPMGSLP